MTSKTTAKPATKPRVFIFDTTMRDGEQSPGATMTVEEKLKVADALVDWPGAIILVSHDEDFVRELAPTKVLLMPDGDVDYFSEDWLDLVSMS